MIRRIVNVGLAACVALATLTLEAAVPVEESTGTTVRGGPSRSTSTAPAARTYPANAGTTPASAPAPTNSSAGGTSELFYQLQLLQNEVSELRGMIEELAHRTDKLDQNQKEQYLDVDRRLSALAGVGGGSSASSGSSPYNTSSGAGRSSEPPPPLPRGGVSSSGAPSSGALSSGNEQNDYAAAYQFIKDKNFEQAISAFNQFLGAYPDGTYGGNAYYWLGESYLALPDADLERARQSFSQVVQRYPDHTKVPDALFKLGVVYHLLGDKPRAMEYLNRVQKDYDGTLAARLALSYSAELN